MRPDNHLLRSTRDPRTRVVLDWLVCILLGAIFGALLAGWPFFSL